MSPIHPITLDFSSLATQGVDPRITGMSQPLPLTATQTPSVIVVTTVVQTSQIVSATHSQVTGESLQAVPSTLAPMLPIAPPQTGTDNTIPSSVTSSDPQQQAVLVSQPPPPATLEAPVIVTVTVAATTPVG